MQDNAPAHAMAAATKCSFEVCPHLPYFPDLAHLDFYRFPNLKSEAMTVSYNYTVDEYLGDQGEGFYFEGISKLEQCWRKCIKAKDDSIEKEWHNFCSGHS